jgi:hypothetical protein
MDGRCALAKLIKICIAFFIIIFISSSGWALITNPQIDTGLKIVIGISALALDIATIYVSIKDP